MKADVKTPVSRREQVLDAAEELFSRRGFYGVTVRQVAAMAGVDVALPSYYFESKRGLFHAVFLRRAEVWNAERIEVIDAILKDDAPVQVEDVLTAFVRPVMEAQASPDPRWRNYCRLVAQVNSSEEWAWMMTAHFDDLVHKLVEALKRALPGVAEKEIYWTYHLLSGALCLTMANTGRVNRLSKGQCLSEDAADAYAHLVDVFSRGFRGLKVQGA